MATVTNILAALLLALLPALEPCRLHSIFCDCIEAHAAQPERHCCHDHGDVDHDHDSTPDCPDCPDCPKACNHLNDSFGLPAFSPTSVTLNAAPTFIGVRVPPVSGGGVARNCAWFYQQPPPTGVLLVGTSNLRV